MFHFIALLSPPSTSPNGCYIRAVVLIIYCQFKLKSGDNLLQKLCKYFQYLPNFIRDLCGEYRIRNALNTQNMQFAVVKSNSVSLYPRQHECIVTAPLTNRTVCEENCNLSSHASVLQCNLSSACIIISMPQSNKLQICFCWLLQGRYNVKCRDCPRNPCVHRTQTPGSRNVIEGKYCLYSVCSHYCPIYPRSPFIPGDSSWAGSFWPQETKYSHCLPWVSVSSEIIFCNLVLSAADSSGTWWPSDKVFPVFALHTSLVSRVHMLSRYLES